MKHIIFIEISSLSNYKIDYALSATERKFESEVNRGFRFSSSTAYLSAVIEEICKIILNTFLSIRFFVTGMLTLLF